MSNTTEFTMPKVSADTDAELSVVHAKGTSTKGTVGKRAQAKGMPGSTPKAPKVDPKVAKELAEKAAEEAKKAAEEEAEAKKREEFLKIFDSIMFAGTYSEVIQVGKNYKLELRSRTAYEDLEISKRLDGMTFNTAVAYQNQASLITLAYSTVRWAGRNIQEMSIDDRYKFLCDMPSAITVLLANELVKFDVKILSALEYGQENF